MAAVAAAIGALLGMPLNRMLRVGFRWFDRVFHFVTGLYTRGVGGLLRVSVLVLLVYCGLAQPPSQAQRRTTVSDFRIGNVWQWRHWNIWRLDI